jgi:hypothetical protein
VVTIHAAEIVAGLEIPPLVTQTLSEGASGCGASRESGVSAPLAPQVRHRIATSLSSACGRKMAAMNVSSLAFAALLTSAAASAASHSFDVVIYGGTAGGVIAAVSAAREGLKTALLEPGAHLGGMVSSGLGFTDYGKKEVIGGYALEFYLRAGRHYQLAQYAQKIAWLHEPGVAEAIFNGMAREAGVTVFLHTRLREHGGVTKNNSRIASVIAENGDAFDAKVFIDSSYEGDLMAQAGVSYIVGLAQCVLADALHLSRSHRLTLADQIQDSFHG